MTVKWLSKFTHLCQASHKRDLANSIDPDQMPQNTASDSSLLCLYNIQERL